MTLKKSKTVLLVSSINCSQKQNWAPGNLSLYLNRLKERGLLMVPLEHGDKNRFSLRPMLVGHTSISNRYPGECGNVRWREGDPRDDPDSGKTEINDCSFQNHTKAIFRKVATGVPVFVEPSLMRPTLPKVIFRMRL